MVVALRVNDVLDGAVTPQDAAPAPGKEPSAGHLPRQQFGTRITDNVGSSIELVWSAHDLALRRGVRLQQRSGDLKGDWGHD